MCFLITSDFNTKSKYFPSPPSNNDHRSIFGKYYMLITTRVGLDDSDKNLCGSISHVKLRTLSISWLPALKVPKTIAHDRNLWIQRSTQRVNKMLWFGLAESINQPTVVLPALHSLCFIIARMWGALSETWGFKDKDIFGPSKVFSFLAFLRSTFKKDLIASK